MTKKTLNKPFYHHFIRVEKIYIAVKKSGLRRNEEKEIWELVEETIHTRILNALLEKLPEGKHEEFLEKFSLRPDDTRLIDYFRQEATDIESHLEETFRSLEEEILADIISS